MQGKPISGLKKHKKRKELILTQVAEKDLKFSELGFICFGKWVLLSSVTSLIKLHSKEPSENMQSNHLIPYFYDRC